MEARAEVTMAFARSKPSQEPSPSPEVAPSPSAEPAGFEAAFDTPGHVEVGDDIDGAPVDVRGVVFTPGELAALVDFVGPLQTLYQYEPAVLARMKELVAAGCEDAAVWNELTGGAYTRLSLDNEGHFAPGAHGGPDFRSNFIGGFSAAFAKAQEADAHEEGARERIALMNQARLLLYDAEHYLQDAFSAGHQVSAGDVGAAVDALLADTRLEPLYPHIAGDIVARESDVTSRYALRGLSSPIDSAVELLPIVTIAGLLQGPEGIQDAARATIHVRLEEIGVEAASPAHPTPWVLTGDHHPEENEETMAALRLALTEVRDAIELGAVPGLDPSEVATRLFERHCPVPTGNGQAVVDAALAEATRSGLGLAGALADAACAQIEVILDAAVEAGVAVRLDPVEPPEVEAPEYVTFPDSRPSYVPGF